MEKIISVLKSIYEFVAGLSIEHITLLSVLVTLVIFVFDKRKDTKNAQLEARREQYKKFIAKGYTEIQAKLKVSKLLGHEREDVTRIYLASLKQKYYDGWIENKTLKTLYIKVSHKYFVRTKSLEDSRKWKIYYVNTILPMCF